MTGATIISSNYRSLLQYLKVKQVTYYTNTRSGLTNINRSLWSIAQVLNRKTHTFTRYIENTCFWPKNDRNNSPDLNKGVKPWFKKNNWSCYRKQTKRHHKDWKETIVECKTPQGQNDVISAKILLYLSILSNMCHLTIYIIQQ